MIVEIKQHPTSYAPGAVTWFARACIATTDIARLAMHGCLAHPADCAPGLAVGTMVTRVAIGNQVASCSTVRLGAPGSIASGRHASILSRVLYSES
eukprot:1161621-Pelagomonas_calceolata.AAC.1